MINWRWWMWTVVDFWLGLRVGGRLVLSLYSSHAIAVVVMTASQSLTLVSVRVITCLLNVNVSGLWAASGFCRQRQRRALWPLCLRHRFNAVCLLEYTFSRWSSQQNMLWQAVNKIWWVHKNACWLDQRLNVYHHPIFISFFHLPRYIASCLFKLHAWKSFCTTSFHVLFGLPLGLEPFISHSIHFFTQPVSSFRSKCA